VAEEPTPSRKPARKPGAKPARKPGAKTNTSPNRTPTTRSGTRAKGKRPSGRRKATVRAALGSVVLVGLLFAFVYPTRTFLDQRADTNRARAQLELLRSENERLAQETKKLQSDSEIERRGRAYGLVRPGERPFVIIPEPTTTLPAETQNPAP
jgi:cell division protein FtsB